MRKNLEFALLNAGNLICCLGLSLIAPFYPTYSEKFDISESLLGFIFSIFPVGGILSSLIVGKMLNNNNQAIFLSVGLFIQAIGMLCYPILTLIEDRNAFIVISFMGRFISGFGSQTFLTPLYASIPQKFKESVEQKMAIAEFFSSFGFLCGPVFGSLLYSIGGFSFPFLLFSSCSIIIAIILKFQFGKSDKIESIDVQRNDSNLQDENSLKMISQPVLIINDEHNLAFSILDNLKEQEIGYLQILSIYSVSSTLQIIFALLISYTFYSPILAKYYKNKFDILPEKVGYFMSATALSYSLGAIIVSKVQMNKIHGIFFGMLIVSFSQFFMGPDPITQLEPQIYITVSAQFMYGLCQAPPYIFVLPLMTQELEQKFEKSQHEKCISLASGLFNAAISAGELFGPTISGFMAQYISFERSCSYLGFYMLISTFIFLPNFFLSKTKI